MKRSMLQLFAMICLSLISTVSMAQNTDNPAAYMSFISKAQNDLSVKYLGYMSAASHGKRVKIVEKRRAALIDFIYEARVKINSLPTFKGDASIRDSAVNYLKLMYSVFNEDYAKIVNMEEIAEQSYDNMEAYLMAKEKANERLGEAGVAYTNAQKDFARRNNVTLIDEESEVDKKLAATNLINQYYNKVYLIFFKANRQETYLLEALDTRNTNAIEQNRSALSKYSSDGIEKLRELKGYESDRSLENTCRKTLEFYKDEAEKKITVLSDFIISAANFEQVKKAFNEQPPAEKTKQSVDNYNKTVDDLNKGANNYNALNKQLAGARSMLISSYNSSVDNFMDTHMPYAK